MIGDEDGWPYLEQHSVNSLYFKLMNPTFLTGDADWSDYTVEAKVKPLSLDEMAGIWHFMLPMLPVIVVTRSFSGIRSGSGFTRRIGRSQAKGSMLHCAIRTTMHQTILRRCHCQGGGRTSGPGAPKRRRFRKSFSGS